MPVLIIILSNMSFPSETASLHNSDFTDLVNETGERVYWHKNLMNKIHSEKKL